MNWDELIDNLLECSNNLAFAKVEDIDIETPYNRLAEARAKLKVAILNVERNYEISKNDFAVLTQLHRELKGSMESELQQLEQDSGQYIDSLKGEIEYLKSELERIKRNCR